mgnify:CR=1 FL=1
MLEHYPASKVVIGVSIFVGFVLFLTPADSGAVMMANLSCKGGKVDEAALDYSAWDRDEVRDAHCRPCPEGRQVTLLTDGMQMPTAQQLPEPLQFFGEAHARPLRTDDWNADLQRIVDDLRAHRIAAPAASPIAIQPLVSPMATTSAPGLLRWLKVGGAAVAVRQVEQCGIDGIDGVVAPRRELRAQPVGDGVAEAAFARAAVQQGQMKRILHGDGLPGDGTAG